MLYLHNTGADLAGVEITVTDLTGRTVYRGESDWAVDEVKEIDLSRSDNGMYLVNLVKDGVHLKTVKVFMSK